MGKKTLLFGTLVAGLLLFGIATVVHLVRKPVSMDTRGFPSMGSETAPVDVVLIEDFQCKNCKAFSKKVIPNLYKQYVKEGRVRFILIPVAFLSGSQTTANALLEVFSQNPSQLFPYMQDILNQEKDLKIADLIRLAKRRSGINLEVLQECIEKGCHREELLKNLHWAQDVMGSQFRTPALFVNGAIGSIYSFEAVKHQIDLNLDTQ